MGIDPFRNEPEHLGGDRSTLPHSAGTAADHASTGLTSSTKLLVGLGAFALTAAVSAVSVVLLNGPGPQEVGHADREAAVVLDAAEERLSTPQEPSTAPTDSATVPPTVGDQLPTLPTAPPPTPSIDPSPLGEVEALRDHIVAVLWSDFGSLPSNVASSQAARWTTRYGTLVRVVEGNWYRSIRDGTVAVVYDGSFSSVRDAAQWCVNQGIAGTNGTSCFGVILNDNFSEQDRGDGRGRFYPANL